MAAVRVDRGPVTADLKLREVEPERWHLLLGARRHYLEIHIRHDCRSLVEWVHDAEVMYEQLGYDSADALLSDGLGIDPDDVRIAVEWLTKHEPEEPIGLPAVLGKHGEYGRGRPKNRVDNRNSNVGGTRRSYTLARLRRDHPRLAAQVEAGEISANAAAVEAGFRRKTITVDATDPQRAARQLARVYDPEALARIVEAWRES